MPKQNQPEEPVIAAQQKPAKVKTKQSQPCKQPVSGIFLLDKPKGLTSNAAMQRVRRLFSAAKAGHTGALDPMATGLLPICLGEATKFSHHLLDSDKSYQATLSLGAQTDTGDAQGEVISTSDLPKMDVDRIKKTLQTFMGEQLQTPPMYSALKKNGRKLYELARAGIEIDRPARPIIIKQLELIRFDKENITFCVTCTKGTYVRVLGEDIAKALGTLGHLTALKRTQTGCFDLADALTLEQLEELNDAQRLASLLPSYASIDHFIKIQLSEYEMARINLGQRLNVFDRTKPLGIAAAQQVLMFCEQRFLGVGELEPTGRLQPKKVVKIVLGK